MTLGVVKVLDPDGRLIDQQPYFGGDPRSGFIQFGHVTRDWIVARMVIVGPDGIPRDLDTPNLPRVIYRGESQSYNWRLQSFPVLQ